jgi:DNA repair exonuclease SbcCD nuclease subunit
MVIKNRAVICDQHLGARSDSPIFLDYFQRFYDNIFFPYLLENKITEIISAGDLFDRRKFVNFVTLQRARQMFFEPLQKHKIKVHCLLGNHDTYFKNTSNVNSVQEILGQYSNWTIYDTATELTFDKTKVLLVPWMNDENYDESLKLIKSTTAKILMGHLEIKGFPMARGGIKSEGFEPVVFKKFKAVASGHLHHKSDEKNIHFLGSPYEIKFDDMNDPRGFHTWKSDTYKFEFHENPYRMFYKIYYDDKDKSLDFLMKKISTKFTGAYVKVVVMNRSNPIYFDKFIEKLFSIGPVDVKIDDDLRLCEDEEMRIDLTEDTFTVLCKYIDNLEIDFNKDMTKEEIKTLHQEALGMER